MKNQRGVTSRRLSADCNYLGEPAETPVLTTYSALGTDAALITDSDDEKFYSSRSAYS
jgi:hypothetical protein